MSYGVVYSILYTSLLGTVVVNAKAKMWMSQRIGYSLTICAILACLFTDITSGSISVCITNCGQCKQMFGNYFNGQACAEFCLATNGFISPDCNNPNTVRNFLKRLQ